jgi:hypothetical protein
MSQVTLQERVTAAAQAAFLPADEREALEISLEEEFNQLNGPC